MAEGTGGVDLATLGIRVDGRDVVRATAELKGLAAEGAKAEAASNSFSDRVQRNAKRDAAAIGSYQRAMKDRLSSDDILAASAEYDRRFNGVVETTEKVDKSTRKAGVGMHRLNNSLIVLARQATGAHPAIGQVADIVGTFAIGTAKMVPILAGFAALGFGIQAMSRASREAKRELEAQLEVLRKIANERDIERRGGATRIALDAGRAEAQRIATLLEQAQNLNNQGLIANYSKQLAEQNRLNREAAGELADDQEAVGARLRREVLARNNAVEAAAQAHQDRLTRIAKEAADERASDRRTEFAIRLAVAAAVESAEAERARKRREDLAIKLAVQKAVEKRTAEEAALVRKAEEEAARAQERALNSLVQALNNVGRAYGGVADQILAIVSAVISLERMPMNTTGDKAKAFGAAAATGVGIGATSGSPIIGGIGGAASGFATAGATGAIIGGVAGIVSGLLEQGRRMDVAKARWEQSLDDFKALSDPGSSLDQGMRQINKAFLELSQAAAAASGISSNVIDVEQARATVDHIRSLPINNVTQGFHEYANQLEAMIGVYEANKEALEEQARLEQMRAQEDLRVRLLRAQGSTEEADTLEREIRQSRELQAAIDAKYDAETIALIKQVHAAEDLAAAANETRDAINSVTQALNSPQGLNLALLTYRASLTGGRGPRPDVYDGGAIIDTDSRPHSRGGTTVNVAEGAIVVNGARDARETAREVVDHLRRYAGTGGGDPLDMDNQR